MISRSWSSDSIVASADSSLRRSCVFVEGAYGSTVQVPPSSACSRIEVSRTPV